MNALKDNKFNVQELYEKLIKLGRRSAELMAKADLWEEGKKVKIAEIYNSLPEELSIAAKEKAVYSSKEYKDYVKKMLELKREANIAKVEYEAHKILIDMLRTEQSNRRAEMEMETRLT